MPSDFAARAAGHPFRTEGAAVTLHVARVAGADCYCRRHAAPVSLLKMKQYACMQATLAAIAGISAALQGPGAGVFVFFCSGAMKNVWHVFCSLAWTSCR